MASLPETVHALIIKIQKNVKVGLSSRIDLWCHHRDLIEILIPIKSLARSRCWGVKAFSPEVCSPYVPKNIHMPKPTLSASSLDQAIASQSISTPPRGFFSWNISTLTGRRDEVRWLIRNTFSLPAFLALQETQLTNKSVDFRIPGYDVLSSGPANGPGERGVALACSRSLTCNEIPGIPGYGVLVKCFDYQPNTTWVIATMYIPNPRDIRLTTLYRLRRLLHSFTIKQPSMPVMLGGDWNMSPSALNKLFIQWDLPFGVQQVSGSPITRTKSFASLDHIVVNQAAMARLGPTRVCRVSDMSDHWPISVWLRDSIENTDTHIPEQSVDMPRRKFPIKQLQKVAPNFLNHNYWDALLEAPIDSPERLNSFTESFVKITESVSSSVTPTSLTTNNRHSSFAFPRVLDRLLTEKRLRYQQYLSAPTQGQSKNRRYGVYAAAKLAARNALRAYQAERWQESIRSGVERFASGETKQGWKWIRGIGQLNPPRPHTTPLRAPSGELLMDPAQITDRWREHYGALASDCTGNSLSPSKWESSPYASIPHLELPINQTPSWFEIYEVIKSLKKNKAYGSDRIPAEIYQLITSNPPDESQPTSSFARVCWRLWEGMWLTGTVPDSWHSAVIVSIPKQGDLTLPDNYRGIALIDVGLKIFSKMIIRRMSAALEKRNFFIRHQAGFRAKEECIAQVIALRTLVQLRAGQSLPTYACFIDLKKAYDTVPIESLLAKLRFAGVAGPSLSWLTYLYHNSYASARAGPQVSSQFPIQRGVRQGCPMSPTLFNIFINDILVGTTPYGATYGNSQISGLLFADDLVLVANTPAALQHSLDAVSKWATYHEMSFGLSKCGVIRFSPTPVPRLRTFRLLGEPVPVVKQYTYLGVIFTSDLDLTPWVQSTLTKVARVQHITSHLLANKDIPVHLRLIVVRALIESRLRYGSALLATNPSLCTMVQRQYDSVVKTLLGSLGSKNTIFARLPLLVELDLPPFKALAEYSAVQAYYKYSHLKTYVSELMQYKSSRQGARLWHTRVNTIIKKYGTSLHASPSKHRKFVIYDSHITGLHQKNKTQAWDRYYKFQFNLTNTFLKTAVNRPDLARGTVLLSRLRLNAWWFETRAAKAKLIPFQYMHRCTTCGSGVITDHITHYLIDCHGHYQARESSLLADLIHRVRQQFGTALTSADLTILLLGGSIRGMTIGPSWDLPYPQTTYSATPPPIEVLCQFLQLTASLTITRLWSVGYDRL